MKGPLKLNNSITSKVYRFEIWIIPFCKNNIRAKNKDPRMYV